MTTVIEMDEKISLGKQLQQRDIGTVIIISTFTANDEDISLPIQESCSTGNLYGVNTQESTFGRGV